MKILYFRPGIIAKTAYAELIFPIYCNRIRKFPTESAKFSVFYFLILCYNSGISSQIPFPAMPLARGAPCKDDAAHCLPSFYRDGSITELPCQTGTQAGITGPDVPAGAFYERRERLCLCLQILLCPCPLKPIRRSALSLQPISGS